MRIRPDDNHRPPDIELRRRAFLPDRIRVLMLGESPPRRGFFYDGNSTLFRATRPVLCDRLRFPEEPKPFLARFKKEEWYRDDIHLPGDKPHAQMAPL